MSIKLVESSLNLRIERNKTNMDYTLSADVAEKQLEFAADIYANVEYMNCNSEDYLNKFIEKGYSLYISTDSNHRGVMCAVKSDYEAKILATMENLHFMHLELKKDGRKIDLIVLRILVAGGGDEDFKSRAEQWQKFAGYINSLEDKSNVIVTGDFNNGVISDRYDKISPRRFYNYQMIVRDLKDKGVALYEMEGCSLKNDMKIDHIAAGKNISITKAEYVTAFDGKAAIGIPDHNLIVAEFDVAGDIEKLK